MIHYYAVCEDGYLVAYGSCASAAELDFYRKSYGSRFRAGAVKGMDGPAPGEGYRWHVDRSCWVPPAINLEREWEIVRYQRDKLLTACDWRILPDAPTPQADRELWLSYRQALRDITNQDDPLAIEWPDVPSVTT